MESWEKHDYVKTAPLAEPLPPYGELFFVTEYPEPQPQFDSYASHAIERILARRKAEAAAKAAT